MQSNNTCAISITFGVGLFLLQLFGTLSYSQADTPEKFPAIEGVPGKATFTGDLYERLDIDGDLVVYTKADFHGKRIGGRFLYGYDLEQHKEFTPKLKRLNGHFGDVSEQYGPIASGNRAVYRADVINDVEIYDDLSLYDFATNKNTRLTFTPDETEQKWDFSGNLVIYAVDGPDSALGVTELHALTLNADGTVANDIIIHRFPLGSFVNQIALEGNYIGVATSTIKKNPLATPMDLYVFTFADTTFSNVDMMTVAKDTLAAPGRPAQPIYGHYFTISGDSLIWADTRKGDSADTWSPGTHLWEMNLINGTASQLTNSNTSEVIPVLAGDILIYQSIFDEAQRVREYIQLDLVTGEEEHLFFSGPGHHLVRGLHTDGRRFVFQDDTTRVIRVIGDISAVGPDLKVDTLSAELTKSGKRIKTRATISNTGNRKSERFLIHVLVTDDKGKEILLQKSFRRLVPGRSTRLSSSKPIPASVTSGPHVIRVVVDVTDTNDELDEDNNQAVTEVVMP